MRDAKRVRPIQQLERATEIATILSSNGFGWLVDAAGLGPYVSLVRRARSTLPWASADRPVAVGQPLPVRLRRVLEELGPTFVKAGQLMALRPDRLPRAYAEELRLLQAQVARFPSEQSQQIIEAELGRPLAEVFSDFEAEPFAAASLSQVHRARLPDGRRVAVKVQRPGVEAQFTSDLALLGVLARQLERRMPRSWSLSPTAAIDELARWSRRELDFRSEARTAQAVARMFADDPEVVIPEVDWDRTTSRVLTTDLIEGVHPTAEHALAAAGIDAERAIVVGTHAMMRQIFRFGLFHADPHPGNLLLQPTARVAFLDFGIFGRLSRHHRRHIGLVLWALVEQDYEAVPDLLLRLAELRPDADLIGFRNALSDVVEEWDSETGRTSVPRLLMRALGVGGRHGVVFSTDLVLLARSLISLEATVTQIRPDAHLPDLLRSALPELRRSLLPGPDTLRATWQDNRYDYLGIALDLPDLIADLVPALLQRSTAQSAPPAPVVRRGGRGVVGMAVAAAVGAVAGSVLSRRWP
jgi:ubiquinone biosynthesis protein